MWEGEWNWVEIYARPVGTPKYMGLIPIMKHKHKLMDGIDRTEWVM